MGLGSWRDLLLSRIKRLSGIGCAWPILVLLPTQGKIYEWLFTYSDVFHFFYFFNFFRICSKYQNILEGKYQIISIKENYSSL